MLTKIRLATPEDVPLVLQFIQKLGGSPVPDWTTYRLQGGTLDSLVGG